MRFGRYTTLLQQPRAGQTINTTMVVVVVAMIIIYISPGWRARLENWPPPNKLSAISVPGAGCKEIINGTARGRVTDFVPTGIRIYYAARGIPVLVVVYVLLLLERGV